MLEPLRQLSERLPLLGDREPPSPVTVRSAFRFLLWRGRLTVLMSLLLVALYVVLDEVALAGLLVSALVAIHTAMFVGVVGSFEEWGYVVGGAVLVVAPLLGGWWLLRGWGEVGGLLLGFLAVGTALAAFAGYTETRRLQHGPFVE